MILEIWKGAGGERPSNWFPLSVTLEEGDHRMSLAGAGSSVEGGLPREGPPGAEVCPASLLSLHCATHKLAQDSGFEPGVQSPCETFPRRTLLQTDRRCPHPLGPGPPSPLGLWWPPSFSPLFPSLRLRTKVQVKLWCGVGVGEEKQVPQEHVCSFLRGCASPQWPPPQQGPLALALSSGTASAQARPTPRTS